MNWTTIRPLLLPGLLLVGLWLTLFAQVSGEWSVVPQYSYGWAVPLLAGWAAWNRWLSRPAPGWGPSAGVSLLLATGLLLLFGATRLVQEGNRDWRLVSWLLGGEVAALSALALAWAGGWPWLRHFAFALLFPLVAVPWPSALEDPMVHGLMQFVAKAAAGILQELGIRAVAQGNLIVLAAGPVGVDEACSGIQSFQASVMVSLFLGEMFGFLVMERVKLFLFAVVWAFLCNIGRTFFLCYMAQRHGLEAVPQWHDTAGYSLMAVCYGGVFGLAIWWDRQGVMESVESSGTSAVPRRLPPGVLVAGLAWLATVAVVTEWWYRRGEARAAAQPGWAVRFPEEAPYKAKDYSERERTLLRYNESYGREWKDAAGHGWVFNFFRWDTGNAGADNAKYHRPTVCLADVGYVLQHTEPLHEVVVNGVRLPVRQYRFTAGLGSLDSFYCLWDELSRPGYTDPTASWDPANWSARARFQNALAGRRGGGIQLINAAVYDAESPAAAAQEFERVLTRVIVPR